MSYSKGHIFFSLKTVDSQVKSSEKFTKSSAYTTRRLKMKVGIASKILKEISFMKSLTSKMPSTNNLKARISGAAPETAATVEIAALCIMFHFILPF